jgi:Protein of unknown function (DUF3667)
MSHSKYYHPHCLNCHYPLAEFDKFCPNCGQKPVAPKSTMHDLWHEFIHTFFHLDGKFFTTLTHLFIPGKLTEEYFRGHHKRYAHPIQLFLVLGGVFLLVITSVLSKTEGKLQNQLDKQQNERKIRRTLAKMDSTARQMSAYKDDPSVKKAIDSLLKKQLSELENVQRQQSKPSELGTQYANNREKLFEQRLKIARFEQQMALGSAQNSDQKLVQLLEDYKTRRTKFETDSVSIIAEYAKAQKFNTADALQSLDSRYEGMQFAEQIKGRNGKNDGEWLKNTEKRVTEDIQKDINNIKDSSANKNKFDISFNSEADDAIKVNDGTKRGATAQDILKNSDSVTMFTMRIAQNDVLDFSADEIVEKYKVKGFFKQRFIKRSVLAIQQGGTMLHTFLSKFLWVIIASLLPLAGVMQLLYWRQKRYFSEHLVWLLHYHALTFIITPLIWIIDFAHNEDVINLIILPLAFVGVVVPFLAIKRYYKQNWGKTIVKGLLFQLAYVIIGLFTFMITAVISFLFL